MPKPFFSTLLWLLCKSRSSLLRNLFSTILRHQAPLQIQNSPFRLKQVDLRALRLAKNWQRKNLNSRSELPFPLSGGTFFWNDGLLPLEGFGQQPVKYRHSILSMSLFSVSCSLGGSRCDNLTKRFRSFSSWIELGSTKDSQNAECQYFVSLPTLPTPYFGTVPLDIQIASSLYSHYQTVSPYHFFPVFSLRRLCPDGMTNAQP